MISNRPATWLKNMRFFAAFFFCLFITQVTNAADFKVVKIAEELDRPWAIEFLPNGDYLVTEKPGRLLRVTQDGQKIEIKGLPHIQARSQGGLLDITRDPDFETNRTVYFSYVARGMGGSGTEVATAKLENDTLSDLKVIFKAKPKMRSDVHFGSRILIAPDETLYITLGERFRMKDAQNTGNHLGAIIRLNKDGSIPEDNPFKNRQGAQPEIFSYGHRNVQGIALQPGTNTIWAHEHGPKGGDEVNIVKSGANYGWPAISYGIDYDGSIITAETGAPSMEQPVIYWVPSIAPCGMAFYDGDKFPEWKGDLFVGALVGQHLRHLKVEGQSIIEQDILLKDLGARIRDVGTGRDGYIYFITDDDNGALYRLEPA